MGENASSMFMASSSLVQAGASFGAGYAQSKAQEAQGAYTKQQYDFNSKIAELQAEDAIKRGDIAASNARTRGKQVVGAQKTTFAAGNVAVDTGTAVTLASQTKEMAALDAMTIKNNAFQEAWGYRMQALDYTGRGNFAASTAGFEATNSLLSGGLNAISYSTKTAGYLSDYYGGDKGKAPILTKKGG